MDKMCHAPITKKKSNVFQCEQQFKNDFKFFHNEMTRLEQFKTDLTEVLVSISLWEFLLESLEVSSKGNRTQSWEKVQHAYSLVIELSTSSETFLIYPIRFSIFFFKISRPVEISNKYDLLNFNI